MNRLLRLLPLLALAGCAAAYSAPSSNAIVQLRNDRDACLMRNAGVLDDGRSDPAAVGAAVVAACQPENNRIIAAIAGPDDFRRSEITRQVQQDSQQSATRYVLQYRAARARS